MKTYYRVSEAASLLHMSASSLRKLTEQGVVECSRNHAGQRVYTPEHIQSYLGEELPVMSNSTGKFVFYVRASDGSQVRLDNQEQLLTKKYGEPERVFKDKASGLNEHRAGLKSLLNRAKKREFDTVIITAKDRLTRFGFTYLERLLGEYDVKIVVLESDNDHKDSLQEELLKDFMSLIASFSGKFYRLRGNDQRQKFLDTAKEQINNE